MLRIPHSHVHPTPSPVEPFQRRRPLPRIDHPPDAYVAPDPGGRRVQALLYALAALIHPRGRPGRSRHA